MLDMPSRSASERINTHKAKCILYSSLIYTGVKSLKHRIILTPPLSRSRYSTAADPTEAHELQMLQHILYAEILGHQVGWVGLSGHPTEHDSLTTYLGL